MPAAWAIPIDSPGSSRLLPSWRQGHGAADEKGVQDGFGGSGEKKVEHAVAARPFHASSIGRSIEPWKAPAGRRFETLD